jgi:hypothetical protein
MKQKFIFIVTIFIVNFLATMSIAGGIKVYPGAMGVTDSSSHSNIQVDYYGRIFNTSTSKPIYVQFPAIHDGGSSISGWVRVIDNHPTGAVSCQLQSHFQIGSSISGWVSGFKFSKGFGPTVQRLDFGSLPATVESCHYFFLCRIPPAANNYQEWRSGIVSYMVNEK